MLIFLNSKSSTSERPLQPTEGRDRGEAGRSCAESTSPVLVRVQTNLKGGLFPQRAGPVHVLFRFWPAEERVLAAGDRACAAARAATLRSTRSGVPSVPELLVTSFDSLLDL